MMKSLFKKSIKYIAPILSFIILVFSILSFFSVGFPDKMTFVLKNLSSKYPNENQNFVLVRNNDWSFKEYDTWYKDVQLFDGRFNKYSSLFRVIDNDVTIEDETNFSISEATICDVCSYDSNFLFGNVVLLNARKGIGNQNLFLDNDILVSKTFAENYIDAHSSISDFDSLIDQPVVANICGIKIQLSIGGVFDEGDAPRSNCFNKVYYDSFGDNEKQIFFVNRQSLQFVEEGSVCCVFPTHSYSKNSAVYDYIRIRFGESFFFPECKTNSLDIKNNISLSEFYANFYSSLFSGTEILLCILFALLVVVFSVIFYSNLKKMIALYINENYMFFSTIASILLVTILIIVISLAVNCFSSFSINGLVFTLFLSKSSIYSLFCFAVFNISFIYLLSWFYYRLLFAKNVFEKRKIKLLEHLRLSNIYNRNNDSFPFFSSNNESKNCSLIFSRSISKSSAPGQRTYCDACLLSYQGQKVIIEGLSDKKDSFEGNQNITVNSHLVNGLKNKMFYFFSTRFIKQSINSALKSFGTIKYVLVYSVLSIRQILALKKLSKVYGFKIIYDIVEFQNVSEQSFLSFFSYYLPNIIINKYLIKKNDNVIAISSFLTDFFIKKQAKVLNIPFLNIRTEKLSPISKGDFCDKKVFLYAGSPGKKDNLPEMIKAFLMLNKQYKNKFVFIVAGVDSSYLVKNGFSKTELKESESFLILLGKIPFCDVEKLYSFSDFVVLLKNNKARHAKADFPSKISQAISYGIPIIANNSSDLEMFLSDGENGFVVKDNSAHSLHDCLIKAMNVDSSLLSKMHSAALKASQNYFSISQFKDCLSFFE